MSTLIRDLLSYSRVNTRGERFQQTQAGESLEFALKNLSSAVQQSGCRIMQDQLPTVYADKIQLAQLFQNLIGNAIKYRMPGRNPEIRISVRQDIEEGCFVFNIEDNGIGFEQQYEEKIFRIFQRLHSRNKYTGTGIGLAICKRIVERHGGRIWAVGKPNEGSVFSFTIPMHGINYDERNRRLAAH
jgi:light-regulated signal transduction histidine kinase (bacteriophytochrome)